MYDTSKLRAFKAITHAVVISIFGESPRKHPSWENSLKIEEIDALDGATVQRGLDMMMIGHRPDLGLESLRSTGFLAALLPDVQKMVGFGGYEEGHKDLWDHTKKVVRNAPPKLEIRWAALFHDVGKPSAFRKKNNKVTFHSHETLSVVAFQRACETTVLFPDHKFRETVALMIETLGLVESYKSDWTDSAVRRVRRKIEDPRVWQDLLDLARSDCTSAHQSNRDRARAKTNHLESRAVELLKAEENRLKMKLPKGLGTIIANEFNLSGSKLGKMMALLQTQVDLGVLIPGVSPPVYVEWIRNNVSFTNEQKV